MPEEEWLIDPVPYRTSADKTAASFGKMGLTPGV